MAGNEIALLILLGIAVSGLIHWCTYGIISTIINSEKFPLLYTPGSLYKYTKMNWVGCIMTWLILLPFTFALELGGVIKWLFTAGRKSE